MASPGPKHGVKIKRRSLLTCDEQVHNPPCCIPFVQPSEPFIYIFRNQDSFTHHTLEISAYVKYSWIHTQSLASSHTDHFLALTRLVHSYTTEWLCYITKQQASVRMLSLIARLKQDRKKKRFKRPTKEEICEALMLNNSQMF